MCEALFVYNIKTSILPNRVECYESDRAGAGSKIRLPFEVCSFYAIFFFVSFELALT